MPSIKRRKLDVSNESDEEENSDSFDNSDDYDNSGQGNSSNHQQLFRIERKIKEGGELNKRERRLLQNRKSALKCRLKKQEELEKMKDVVDRLSLENRELKEKVGIIIDQIYLIIKKRGLLLKLPVKISLYT